MPSDNRDKYSNTPAPDEESSSEEEVDLNQELIEYINTHSSEDVRDILEEGADANFPDPEDDNLTPLQKILKHNTVEDDDLITIVSLLIQRGANIFLKDPEDGSSLLHKAAARGLTKIAEVLIKEKAHIVYATDNIGDTPLHDAAFFCYPDTVDMLLKYGADPTLENIYDQSPLYRAIRGIFDEDEALLGGEESQWRIQIAVKIAKAIEEKESGSLSKHLETAHIAGGDAKYLTSELIKLICSLQNPESGVQDPESAEYFLDLIIEANPERKAEIEGYIEQAHREFSEEAAAAKAAEEAEAAALAETDRKRKRGDDYEQNPDDVGYDKPDDDKRSRPDSSPKLEGAGPAAEPAAEPAAGPAQGQAHH